MHRDEDGNLVPEQYLYRRRYRKGNGKLVTRFYAVFTDWKGIRRRFALGDKPASTRRKLAGYLKKNDAEVDFDQEKTERQAKGMTFAKWVAQCQKSDDDARRVRLHLEPFFGSKPLSSIDDDAVKDYRKKRASETVIRHGEESTKLVTQTTINKELGTLRKLLRLARKKGYSDKVTGFEMAPEKNRKRILTQDEYTGLLAKCPAWLRRACIMAWETCLSRSDLLALTWEEIDLRDGMIALKEDRAKTGAEQAIPIVTPELKALLAELQAERRRVPNVDGLVLTIDGQPIDELKFEYWFRKARKDAGIKDFTFHDFRHCAITRWAAAGVPTAAAMTAAGHKSVASHKKYQNLQRSHLKAGFLNSKLLTTCEQEKTEKSEKAAS